MAVMNIAEAKAALEKEEQEAAAREAAGDDTLTGAPADDTLDGAGDDTQSGDDTTAGGEGDDTVPGDDTLTDDWTKGDDSPSERIPDSEAAKIRHKYQAPLKKARKELETKDQEIAELRKRLETTAPPSTLTKPERSAFKDDATYQEAVTRWVVADQQARAQSQQRDEAQQRQLAEVRKKVGDDLDQHYTRAAALAAKSNIKPEAYQSADKTVREAIDSIRPGDGDVIVDALIHLVGPGSERVFYKVGVSRAHRDKMVSLIQEDPSFVKVGIFLGKLNAELSSPVRRESRAPDPPADVRGDKAKGATGTKERRDYDAALSAGNTQKAWNIKRAAQRNKINTAAW